MTVKRTSRRKKRRHSTSAAGKTGGDAPASADTRRRVHIVDHQPISRYLLSQIINAEPDLTVCGVSDGLANLPRVIRASNPDLVIIEIAGKSADGLEALRAIREADIRVPVLVFSGGSCEANAIAAMRAGANGYVCKNENKSTLLRAIRLLLRGEERLCREMTARLVKDFSLGFVDARPLPVDLLTAREMNIFRLLARGLNPRQIARRANMDLHAVQSCRQRLKTKLELSSVQELQCAATRWLASQTSATA